MSVESNDTWSFSQTFTTEFQAARIDLESRLVAATAADIQELSTRLAKLSKSLSDATPSLPTYDQKLYATQIKNLEKEIEKLRTSAAPKSRFAFKRTAAAPIAAVAAPPPIQAISPPLSTPAEPTPSADGSQASLTGLLEPPPVSNGLELANHSSRYLSYNDLPSKVTPDVSPDLAISNLTRCIVNLLPPQGSDLNFSALHIRDLSDCVLLLPFTEGSALIHDIKNCVLVLGCHQFRMHTSTKVDVYLRIDSNPIIETCHGIRFGMYPSRLAPHLLQEPPLPPLTVQDFSHIRASPSPNFSLIGSKMQSEVKPWPVEPITASEKLADMLISLLPETSAL
ncbi:hypothetical protein EST38_g8923 [Candolleomyces aberdarensis]|uniref:C-CAP/cofactor C-like domain-containing protein n=1 Tax=Candolleomyces aberdarensis TaxID=2316362 RepID=A0A4Q2DDG5_9AGAR|nr:hypothetical protein EST38_g8923 [Candolleomyces aberdarensis]